MALPRYESQIRVGQIPRIDPAGLREAGRTQETLSRNLDRLASFAFRAAEQQAGIQGAEYGAEKAPTAKQLQDALSAGEDVEEYIPGDTMTVFGQAARKSALASITNSMEIAARQSITQLRMRAEQEEMDVGAFQAEMNDLIEGYAAPLLEISPIAANRFRATAGTVGNTALLSHAEAMNKLSKNRQEIAAIGIIDGIIDEIPTLVSAGTRIDAEAGEILPLADLIQFEREKIMSYGAAADDPSLVQRKLTAFDAAVDQAMVGQVSDWFSEKPLIRGEQLRTGEIDDPAVNDIWSNMTLEQRRKSRQAAFDAESAMLSRESALDSQNERARNERVAALRADIFDARAQGQVPQALLEELRETDEGEYETLASAIFVQGGLDDPDIVAGLEVSLQRRELTRAALDEARESRRISANTFSQLNSRLIGLENDRVREAMSLVSNALGNPEATYFPGKAEREAQKKVADIDSKLTLARINDPDMDPIEFVLKEIDRINTEKGLVTQEQLDAAEASIEALKKALNTNVSDLSRLQSMMILGADDNDNVRNNYNEYTDALKLLIGRQ